MSFSISYRWLLSGLNKFPVAFQYRSKTQQSFVLFFLVLYPFTGHTTFLYADIGLTGDSTYNAQFTGT